MTFQLKDIHNPFPAGQVHHVECELLEDAVVTILVGSSEGGLCYRLAAQAKVVAF
jgi:hypothetical protein